MLKVINIQKDTQVQYSSNELLFLAQSGQPYRGSLYIQFTSIGESFDTLSLKLYITSLRSKKFYSEDIAHEIYSTIEESIQCENLGVVVDLSARGGLQQRVSFGTSFLPVKKENIFQIG